MLADDSRPPKPARPPAAPARRARAMRGQGDTGRHLASALSKVSTTGYPAGRPTPGNQRRASPVQPAYLQQRSTIALMDIQFNTDNSLSKVSGVAERVEAHLRERLGRFEERLQKAVKNM